MPEAPDRHSDGLSHVDPQAAASRGALYELECTAADWSRVREAGVQAGSGARVRFRFFPWHGGIGLDIELEGRAVMTCQRCLQPVTLEMGSSSALKVVPQDTSDPGEREPLVVSGEPLNLYWLAEEEMLLALPLIPVHEECPEDAAQPVVEEAEAKSADEKTAGAERQRPFAGLRDLLNKD